MPNITGRGGKGGWLGNIPNRAKGVGKGWKMMGMLLHHYFINIICIITHLVCFRKIGKKTLLMMKKLDSTC